MSIIIAGIVGSFIGAIIGFFICLSLGKIRSYAGIMKIIRDEDKLVYSLELTEDPIMLQSKNEITFKVETSDESSNRE